MANTPSTALYIGGKERQTAEKMAIADPANVTAFKICLLSMVILDPLAVSRLLAADGSAAADQLSISIDPPP